MIDKTKRSPQYLQLYHQLREDVIRGAYPYGTRMPSKRTLAEQHHISIITVEHAYELLTDEGYVYSAQRSGYFSAYRAADSFPVSALAHHPHRMDNTHVEDFPFSVMAKTMRRIISEYSIDLLKRSPNKGMTELRDALARYLQRSRDLSVQPEQIVIVAGAEYLYSLAVQLLGRDHIYGIEQPSYEKIEQVYRANHVQCRLLPLGLEGILSTALWDSDAQILHITPYRSYPSGVTASAAKRQEYVQWAQQKGRFLIEDDFESEFSLSSKPRESVFALAGGANVLYMNTFSKTLSPAFRTGYMVLPAALTETFDRELGFYSCTVPNFEQLVLAEFIDSGDFERHLNRTRRKLRRAEETASKTNR